MAALEASVAAAKAGRRAEEPEPMVRTAGTKAARKPVAVGPGRGADARAAASDAEAETEAVLARRRKSA
jgi:hypothetical protein